MTEMNEGTVAVETNPTTNRVTVRVPFEFKSKDEFTDPVPTGLVSVAVTAFQREFNYWLATPNEKITDSEYRHTIRLNYRGRHVDNAAKKRLVGELARRLTFVLELEGYEVIKGF